MRMGLFADLVQVPPSGEVEYPILGTMPVWFMPEYHSPKICPLQIAAGEYTPYESHPTGSVEGVSTGDGHFVQWIPSNEVA
jgi:hypothetical protein